MLLQGCASVQSPQTVVIHDCLPFPPPPASVIDAIEGLAATDTDAAIWVVDLEGHYQAIDACLGK